MSRELLRIGLVGYGYWGPNLLRNLVSDGGFEIAGVVDKDSAALARCAHVYPHLPFYGDLTRFLRERSPRAVVLATPPNTHRELALLCLERGASLLVEKPMAVSVAQCDEIIAAAEKHSQRVMVDHTFAFHPAVKYIVDRASAGELGRLLYYDSVRTNLGRFQQATNVLWDLAPHDLSILDLVMEGQMPASLSCTGVGHFDRKLKNLCHLDLTYGKDFVAHLHLNWIAPVKTRSVILAGSRKTVVFDDTHPSEKMRVYLNPLSGDPQQGYRPGVMSAPPLGSQEPLAELVARFHAFLAHGEEPLTDGSFGRRVVRILEAASVSMAEDGARVELASQW